MTNRLESRHYITRAVLLTLEAPIILYCPDSFGGVLISALIW